MQTNHDFKATDIYTTDSKGTENFGVSLVVIDNGFVYIGETRKVGRYYVMDHCANMRKSGASRGYGELAFSGPLSGTVLDHCPQLIVPETAVAHVMKCGSVWDDRKLWTSPYNKKEEKVSGSEWTVNEDGMLSFGLQLVVMDNGFVYMGDTIFDGTYHIIMNAVNLKEAGTNAGFGKIAYQGMGANIELNPCPPIAVLFNRTCHMMRLADVWAKYFNVPHNHLNPSEVQK